VTSFDQLSGTACFANGFAGTISIQYSPIPQDGTGGIPFSGVVGLQCVPTQRFAIVYTKLGAGSGTVRLDKGTVDGEFVYCTTSCSVSYIATSWVQLYAFPDPGSVVTWGGDCAFVGSDPNNFGCRLLMNKEMSVSVTFAH
jgi:hypothetical protein